MAHGGLGRRAFLSGMLGLLAAPAIVRATSLMPVKAWAEPWPYPFQFSGFYSTIPTNQLVKVNDIMNEMAEITRRAFVPRLQVQLYRADPVLHFLEAGLDG